MGNCQATANAEAIVIYHPGIGCNGSYKIYRSSSVTAEEIMVLYPGYYVSLVGTVTTEEGIPLKQIKLLRPRDTLSTGRVYRLISFEGMMISCHIFHFLDLGNTDGLDADYNLALDVNSIWLKDVSLELLARTRGKLVVRGGGDEADEGGGGRRRKKGPSLRTKPREPRTSNCCSYEVVEGTTQIDISDTTTTSTTTTTTSSSSRIHSRPWRPSLESISEFGV